MLETEPAERLYDPPLSPFWRSLRHRIAANRLLAGSTLFFVSTTIVNGGNYLFNLILGRWLGPALFADVSIIITLFLLLTFITAGFQQTAAKFAAIYTTDQDFTRLEVLRRWLHRYSWLIGIICLLIVGGGASFWQQFFHTSSPWLFVLFAIGLPFYFVQGIDRGLLQGQMHFGLLAASYQAEMWVRLVIGLLLVYVGWAAHGAVLGLTLSIVATWLVAAYGLQRIDAKEERQFTARRAVLSQAERAALLAFALPVFMMETSLILINNSDVLLVKRFFDSVTAGHYAALALIGRIVFFGTWSVVITMFPLVTQKQQRREAHRHLLWMSLALVCGVSILIVGATAWMPTPIVRLLFGVEYLTIAPLLWLYATATALFALANVVINYHLALGHRAGVLFALAAGVLQVILLAIFHASLYQVILIQVMLMGALFVLLVGWDWLLHARS